MLPMDTLDELSKTPGSADADMRALAVSQWLKDLHRGNDTHLLSVYAGKDTTWDSPELEGLPLARRWLPHTSDTGHSYLFFDTELAFMHRAGDAVERAASLIGIDLIALYRSPDGAKSLSETLIETLSNEWATPRLCEVFWKDQYLKPASRAVYGLSLEGDSYLVFVGPGDLDEPCVAILGEQPFESTLYPEGTPADTQSEVIPDTSEINGHTIEAKTIIPAQWWRGLVKNGEHTLLRASFMQMAIPGERLDILTPAKTPHWRDVPILPVA